MKTKLQFILFILIILLSGMSILRAQWMQTNFYGVVNCFAVNGENLFAGTNAGFIYLSTNYGTNWTLASSGMNGGPVNALIFKDTNLFAGTNNGVYLSTNYGTNWTINNFSLPTVTSLATIGINLFAGTPYGVYRSADNGLNWIQPVIMFEPINELAVRSTYLYAAAYNNGVFRSNNNGLSWTAVNSGLSNMNVGSFAVCNTNIFAGTYGTGVFLSTNGTYWETINTGLTNLNVTCFSVSGSNIFTGTGSGGIFIIPNGGTTWTEVNLGLTNLHITKLIVNDTYLFAGTYYDGIGSIWRRPLSEMITTVQSISTDIISDYYLGQNYPNPFNPNTIINYHLSMSNYVSLKVYDVLGKEVATLVNEKQIPGTYQVEFDGNGLSSGVYFYKIVSGEFVETKRMVLVK